MHPQRGRKRTVGGAKVLREDDIICLAINGPSGGGYTLTGVYQKRLSKTLMDHRIKRTFEE